MDGERKRRSAPLGRVVAAPVDLVPAEQFPRNAAPELLRRDAVFEVPLQTRTDRTVAGVLSVDLRLLRAAVRAKTRGGWRRGQQLAQCDGDSDVREKVTLQKPQVHRRTGRGDEPEEDARAQSLDGEAADILLGDPFPE